MKVRINEEAPFLCECPRCEGKGKISHECNGQSIREVENLYGNGHGASSYESLGIYVCLVCGQLWMIRNQFDAGTGSDDIWLKPNEKECSYEFPMKEAKKYIEKAEKILKAHSIILK